MKRKRLLLTEILKNSNKMGKVFLFLAAVAVCFCMANEAMAQIVDSGTTGDCTWTLTGSPDNYTLTISGTGAMADYYLSSPWNNYRTSIETVIIEDGVTRIGNGAFRYCKQTSVTIPESVASIGDFAFIECSSLTSVTIPGNVTSIGNYAFSSCGLSSINIPNKMTSIGEGALGSGSLTAIYVADENACFSSADGVLFNKDRTILLCCPGGKAEHYTLPNTVTGIGNYAFEKCHLTSVTIPNSVTDIGENAFKECNLISVTIPGSVTSIGTRAFYNCTYLTSVTIPNNTSIGYQVFLNCRNLTSVTNLRIIPQYITSDVFSDVLLSKATLYVPAESVDRYQDASVWGSFGTITAYAPSAIHAPAVANAIRVYPNPVSESFRIEGITAPTPATVTDISDKTLLQQTVSGDESISVGHLPQGIYLIRVNGITAKIIKN